MERSIKRHRTMCWRLAAISLVVVILAVFFLSACTISTPSVLKSSQEGSPIATGTITNTTSSPADTRPLIERVNRQPIYKDGYEKQVAQMQKAFEDRGMLSKGDQAAEHLRTRQPIGHVVAHIAVCGLLE